MRESETASTELGIDIPHVATLTLDPRHDVDINIIRVDWRNVFTYFVSRLLLHYHLAFKGVESWLLHLMHLFMKSEVGPLLRWFKVIN